MIKKHLFKLTPAVPRLLFALAAGIAAVGVGAAQAVQPRLLLTVMVDGLDAGTLEVLRERFGDGGFRRLEAQGVYIPAVDYGPGLDATAATATLLSGAAPSLSGVDGKWHFDTEALRPNHIFAGAKSTGNSTTTSDYSPAALRVSTIADEARIAAAGTNVAYAVAADPAMAIVLAGHAANSALWLDTKTAEWVSSNYYKDKPVVVGTRNRATPLAVRMDTMSWTPSLKPDQYPAIPEHLRRYPFRYIYPAGNASRLDMFTASPLANNEVTNMAVDLLATMSVGQHEGVTDVLGVAYNLQPYTYGKNPDNRFENLDAYIKLDASLSRLLSDIDRRVGAQNTVVMLAATPPRTRSRRDNEQWGIPYGQFSTRKAISLLNMYLIAMFGNGDYISAYHNGNIYFNHKTLKDRSIDERNFRNEAASFLARMSGVDRVHTIDEIIEGRAGEQPEALRRNTTTATAGDLLVKVAPGFEIVDDYNGTTAEHTPLVERAGGTTAPLYIVAPGIAAQTIGTPVDARTIAPTVCSILRIRSPNGAGQAPLYINSATK